MARYTRDSTPDHSDPWPPPDYASHAASGHNPPLAHRFWPWVAIGALIIILIVGLCMVMSIGLGTGGQTGTKGYVTPSPIGTPKGTPGLGTKPKPKAKPEVKVIKIDEGMFEVGPDVKPGRYKTSGMRPDGLICYWHTAKDMTDEKIKVQGVADKEGAQAYVTLNRGDWFKTSGCAPWVRQGD